MDKYPNDPFMNRERVKERLRSEFKKYGKLIIAYDFDYTVHSYRDEDYSYEFVAELLRRWYPYARLIVFSASPESRYSYIIEYLNQKNIPFDTINEEVIERQYTRKVYYNVFLDDRAGLGETAEILSELLDEIERGELVADNTPKLIRSWEELVGLENEEYKLEIDVEGGCGHIVPKTEEGKYCYLSTHTFYGRNYQSSTRILQKCGFNVQLDNWDKNA